MDLPSCAAEADPNANRLDQPHRAELIPIFVRLTRYHLTSFHCVTEHRMARKSIEQRLAEVENERKTLKARLGKQERARDTRRKVLLGALVLHKLEANTDEEMARRLRDWLRRELPGFLQRDIDKTLFKDLLGQPAKTEMPDGLSEPDREG